MEENYSWKVGIKQNYYYFVNNMSDPSAVVDYLYSLRNPTILTDHMKEAIQTRPTTSQKIREMLDILLRRGPHALRCLYDAFIETENNDCAKELCLYVLAHERNDVPMDPSCWPPPTNEREAMLERPVIYLKPTDPCCFLEYNKNTKEVYSMQRECRGLVFLINNEHFQNLPQRKGTQFDEENLKKLFTSLHFKVIVKKDLTAEEIRNETESITKHDKIRDSDCFIFIILSHGNEKGICGTDGVPVSMTTLTEMFRPNNCPELNEKPKIFLVQACRGRKRETVHSMDNDKLGSHADGGDDQVEGDIDRDPNISSTKTVHSHSDFLVAYSCPEECVTFRNQNFGSWFMLAIVWFFKYESHVKDLDNMLTKVIDFVSRGRAIHEGVTLVNVCQFTSSLRKRFYFFPGIYRNKEIHPMSQLR